MYDYAKLLGRMKERGYTQQSLARNIGISECTLNLKLNNKRGFKQDEIVAVGNLLGISSCESPEYFFTHGL